MPKHKYLDFKIGPSFFDIEHSFLNPIGNKGFKPYEISVLDGSENGLYAQHEAKEQSLSLRPHIEVWLQLIFKLFISGMSVVKS